jgi:hypothetical protein
MVERGPEVEHQIASDDRQERVLRLGDIEAACPKPLFVLGLEPFAHRVTATVLERSDPTLEVTEVMLCPRELFSPGGGHAVDLIAA